MLIYTERRRNRPLRRAGYYSGGLTMGRKRTMRQYRLCFMVAVSMGCGETHDATTTATEPTSSGGGTTIQETTILTTAASSSPLPTVTCDCLSTDGSYDVAMCGWGPCGTVEATCFSLGEELGAPCMGGTVVIDADALSCALNLLIAGDPGVVHYEDGVSNSSEVREGFVKIGLDRKGLSWTDVDFDVGCTFGARELIALRDSDYFSGCEQMSDLTERLMCMTQWNGGVIKVCKEASENCPL